MELGCDKGLSQCQRLRLVVGHAKLRQTQIGRARQLRHETAHKIPIRLQPSDRNTLLQAELERVCGDMNAAYQGDQFQPMRLDFEQAPLAFGQRPRPVGVFVERYHDGADRTPDDRSGFCDVQGRHGLALGKVQRAGYRQPLASLWIVLL